MTKTKRLNDAEAQRFYEDPSNLEPVGPPRRLPGRALTRHVPVRFPPELVEQVQGLADEEGLTVSAWVRRAVKREVERTNYSRFC